MSPLWRQDRAKISSGTVEFKGFYLDPPASLANRELTPDAPWHSSATRNRKSLEPQELRQIDRNRGIDASSSLSRSYGQRVSLQCGDRQIRRSEPDRLRSFSRCSPYKPSFLVIRAGWGESIAKASDFSAFLVTRSGLEDTLPVFRQRYCRSIRDGGGCDEWNRPQEIGGNPVHELSG